MTDGLQGRKGTQPDFLESEGDFNKSSREMTGWSQRIAVHTVIGTTKDEKTMIIKVIGLCAVGFALAATSSYANLVIDGNFALPDGGDSFVTVNKDGYIGGSDAWKVTQGSVDVIGGYWVSSIPSDQSVDVAGNTSGKIEQTIHFPTTTTYRLTFDLAGNPDGAPTTKKVEVTFGGQVETYSFNVPAGASHENMGWMPQSWALTIASGSSLLAFEDKSETAYGAAIANVSVTAVPEPTTMIAGALLLLPFGVSTFRMLRKNRVA
jgi:choice-of-anchor C domain-containing protein